VKPTKDERSKDVDKAGHLIIHILHVMTAGPQDAALALAIALGRCLAEIDDDAEAEEALAKFIASTSELRSWWLTQLEPINARQHG